MEFVRPKYREFEGRVGDRFEVEMMSGEEEVRGEWVLREIEDYSSEGDEEDRFALFFRAEGEWPQSMYRLSCGGECWVLFCVPSLSTEGESGLAVVVN